jgi:hypothetical protein
MRRLGLKIEDLRCSGNSFYIFKYSFSKAGILECDFKSQAPLLDALYEDDNHAWAGGLARKVTRYNIERNIEDNIGTHEEAISCMVRSQEKGCVISGKFSLL